MRSSPKTNAFIVQRSMTILLLYQTTLIMYYNSFVFVFVFVSLHMAIKAVVKYVGGFWPIGVFFAGYRSFFFVPSRQTQTKARL